MTASLAIKVEKLKAEIKAVRTEQKTDQLLATDWIRSLERTAAELQDELDQCARMNDRLNKTIATDREKIQSLKDLVRFYLGQRDRIDAYLSATLTMVATLRPTEDAAGSSHGWESL